MADEFQWWNASRTMFGSASSLCSSAAAIDIGFGWPNDHLLDLKTTRSSTDSATASDGSVVLQELQPAPPHHHQEDSDSGGAAACSMSMGSPLQINQVLFQNNNGTSESNYSSMLQQDLNYATISEASSTNSNTFKPINQSVAFDQQLFSGYSSSSSSYSYPSNLPQTLFDTTPQPQKSMFEDQSIMNFLSNANYPTSMHSFSTPLAKLSPMLTKASFSGQELPVSHQSPLPNNTSGLWNASAAVNEKINLRNLTAKASNNEEVTKKTNHEPASKRPRMETPSPLPTFKVRKEKLGDRITALQQLVSPFGKTDTASVLHEVIEYIKFLHDQVGVLSTPYMKNGPSDRIQRQQTGDKPKDLKSRGLCLVPITSTFPVATETTADFWTPTIGGAFNHRQKGEAMQHLRKQLISY